MAIDEILEDIEETLDKAPTFPFVNHKKIVDGEIADDNYISVFSYVPGETGSFSLNSFYIVFLFKTCEFVGNVISSDEGQMEWVEKSKLSEFETVDDLDELLEVMNNPELTEFQYLVEGDNWMVSVK